MSKVILQVHNDPSHRVELILGVEVVQVNIM